MPSYVEAFDGRQQGARSFETDQPGVCHPSALQMKFSFVKGPPSQHLSKHANWSYLQYIEAKDHVLS